MHWHINRAWWLFQLPWIVCWARRKRTNTGVLVIVWETERFEMRIDRIYDDIYYHICITGDAREYCIYSRRKRRRYASQWIFQFKRLERSCLNWKIHCEDHSSLSSMTAVQIYELFHIYLHHFTPYGKIWTQQIDLAPNVWLHSSVGRASHRYRGGHGFESRWSPDFFQAFSFQLLKLENSLRGSFFTFIYDRSSNIWIISYILTSLKTYCTLPFRFLKS